LSLRVYGYYPRPALRRLGNTRRQSCATRAGPARCCFPSSPRISGYLAPLRLKWVRNTISGPQDIQSVVTGDTDFGGAFNGSIVKLIAAHAPIKAVIGYYGADKDTYTGLYVLDDSPIRTARDLVGKKVGMTTLGAYQEYLLTDYLLRSGLTADSMQRPDRRQYKADHPRRRPAGQPGANPPPEEDRRNLPPGPSPEIKPSNRAAFTR